MGIRTVVILSQCGAGKTTLVEAMEKYGFRQVDCYTTRPPRAYDPGRICITPEEFAAVKPKLVAYTMINGYEYGTTEELIDRGHMYILDHKGLVEFQRNFRRKQMCIVYIEASEQVRAERILANRGPVEMRDRLRHDREAWKGVELDVDVTLKNETPEDLRRNIVVLRALLTHLFGEQLQERQG